MRVLCTALSTGCLIGLGKPSTRGAFMQTDRVCFSNLYSAACHENLGPVHTSRLKSSFGARILMPKCPSTEPGVHTEQALRIRPQTSQSAAVQGRLRSHRKLMIYRCRAYFPLSRGGLKVISSPESRSRLAFGNHVLNGVFIRFPIGECLTWPLFCLVWTGP